MHPNGRELPRSCVRSRSGTRATRGRTKTRRSVAGKGTIESLPSAWRLNWFEASAEACGAPFDAAVQVLEAEPCAVRGGGAH
jgi:hypothetical protein